MIDSFEKKLGILMLVLVVILLGNCMYMAGKIEDAGGVKALIIDAGKELKEISAEIDKHQP